MILFLNTFYKKLILLVFRFPTVLEDAVQKANAEKIVIPFGVGIAGTVAETKETINITDAYADLRFNSDIDTQTGYKTNVMLSMPICNYEGEVIGVAQIINKTNGKRNDEQIYHTYSFIHVRASNHHRSIYVCWLTKWMTIYIFVTGMWSITFRFRAALYENIYNPLVHDDVPAAHMLTGRAEQYEEYIYKSWQMQCKHPSTSF